MKFDLSGVSVMLAMPTHRPLPVPTVVSLLETQDALRANGIPFEFQIQMGSSIIESTRSKAAHLFLKSDKTRLFCVDSDIAWKAGDFIRLLALSTVSEVVCGIYPAKCDPPTFFLNTEEIVEADERGCLAVKGLGLGFTVVQRTVIEQLAAKAKRLRFPDYPEPIPHIFRCDDDNGDFRGEDMAFFADVRALGYRVNLDPTVTLGHVGQKTFRASFMDHLKENKA